MSPAQPQTWHYGLMARWWAEFNVAEPEELAYYRAAIERFGQPALDLGCGAGRILVPLLAQGLAVDGVDLSADMLAQTARLAAAQGLSPTLTAQAMHEFDLPRHYRTIYICDSFGIGGSRANDRLTLRRVHDQLEPGGALVFSHYLPYEGHDAESWARWLPGNRGPLPQPWPTEWERRKATDGDELELQTRRADFDPLLQSMTLEMRIRLWRNGSVIDQDEHPLIENLYFLQELLLMLDDAGFRDVAVEGWYTGLPASTDDARVVMVGRRPA